jgi:DNA-binding PadR family transcriptional regulator
MSTHEEFLWPGRRHGGGKIPPPWLAMADGDDGEDGDERGWRRGRFGPGFGGPGFGGPPGRGRGRGRGGRARRGDVRAAVLLLVAEEPSNGYQIIGELGERSRGAWRPSPGSVYPVLQQLEDEGLVVSAAADVGRVYRITEAGTAHVEANRQEMGIPWEDAADAVSPPAYELAQLIPQVMGAIKQVLRAGTDRQMSQASAVMAETRRSLYRILADDAPDPEGHADAGPSDATE